MAGKHRRAPYMQDIRTFTQFIHIQSILAITKGTKGIFLTVEEIRKPRGNPHDKNIRRTSTSSNQKVLELWDGTSILIPSLTLENPEPIHDNSTVQYVTVKVFGADLTKDFRHRHHLRYVILYHIFRHELKKTGHTGRVHSNWNRSVREIQFGVSGALRRLRLELGTLCL